MSDVQFEWDEEKRHANETKHGIGFTEAASVFYDRFALFQSDPDHSAEEDRFLLLGQSELGRIIVVSHCFRQEDTVIRIVSARKASRTERREYATRWGL